MVIKHLTDDEVQQYVVDKQYCETRIVEHFHLCEECRSKVEVYQLLITGIKQQPQSAFDFDLSKSVLQRLPAQKTKTANDSLLIWLIIFTGISFTGGGLYFFRNYFRYFFEGIETILGFLIVVTALTVLAGLYIDMHKKYRKEMKVLDLG
jgi:hypothetical protein